MMSKYFFRFTALKHNIAAAILPGLVAAISFPAVSAMAQTLVADNGADPATRFTRAQEYLRNGKNIEARAELEIIRFQKDFILADYVAYDLASLALEEKDYAAAIGYLKDAKEALKTSPVHKEANKIFVLASCQAPAAPECEKAMTVINKQMTPSDFKPARLIIAGARSQQAGQLSEAYEYYQRIVYSHPASQEVTQARERMEKMRAEAGAQASRLFADPSYKDKLRRALKLMQAYRYNEAATALEEMIAEGQTQEREAMLRYKLGGALFKARRRDEARQVFVDFSKDFPKHDKYLDSEYYIAIIDWNQDQNDRAKKRLEKLAATGKRSITGLAHYTMGRIAESMSDLDSAYASYSKASRLGMPYRLKNDLRWRLGWVEYKRGKFKQAAELFAKGQSKSPKLQQDGRFLYWQARAYNSAGAKSEANKAEAALDKKFPYTYYGLAETANRQKAEPAPNFIMDIHSGARQVVSPPRKLSAKGSLAYKRGQLLISAGLEQRAKYELDRMLREVRKHPSALAWLGTLYVQAHAPHKAISLFGPIPNGGKKADDFEDAQWRLTFPVNHWEHIEKESKKVNMDPLLPLAVIRQESAFNDKALSSANAMGLMQIVPNTGERMYQRMKLANQTGKPFSTELLFNPEVNIAIGVAYLSDLLERYNGSVTLALAAYNAGEPNVDRWVEKMEAPSQEEFIEMIPYSETRGYVKKVLRNLALYRTIYSRVKITEEPVGSLPTL
ncbi:MAG: transglycosylase SLT domain-containing protein [Nitrospinota bacterium]|nr:transglycosylase SLT domain-containing protein [Nitrospinota bacterium]